MKQNENYEKKYKEALKRAEAAINIAADKDLVKGVATTIFPELQESEFEKNLERKIKCYTGIVQTKNAAKQWAKELMSLAKKELYKDFPKWKKMYSGACGNPFSFTPIFLVKCGGTYNMTKCLGPDDEYIELSELEKLPKE